MPAKTPNVDYLVCPHVNQHMSWTESLPIITLLGGIALAVIFTTWIVMYYERHR